MWLNPTHTRKENNTVRVLGITARTDANVAVAGSAATGQKDRAWGSDYVPANSDHAVQGSVTVYGAIPGGGTGGQDLIKSAAKAYFIPKWQQGFTYDDDGNLVHDSVWDYTYDAENRLISIENNSAVIGTGMIAAGDARKLVFTYDYLGRRVRKTVYGGWNGSAYPGSALTDTKYLYDGWNLIAEFDVLNAMALTRSYTWGLDVTGGLTAAGGVGALLQVYDASGPTAKTLLPTYDGNGNVAAMVNAADGTLEATYEYDPFGNLLRKEGDYAEANPFRFSTKYTDTETGLLYYGHRYYSPSLGRFINRDPSEEQGGVNLYAFCLNNAVNGYDLLGLLTEAQIAYMKLSPEEQARQELLYQTFSGNGGSDDPFIAQWDAFVNKSNRMAKTATYDSPTDFGTQLAAEHDQYISKRLGELWNSLDAEHKQKAINEILGAGVDPSSAASIPKDSADAPNTAASPGIGLPSEADRVPRGSTGIRIIGTNSGDPAAAVADAAATLVFLRRNSPTLDNAIRTVVAKEGYIGIAPVSSASGGDASASNTAIYGTGIVYKQANGGIVYPAYTLAHEIGHLFAVSTDALRGQSSLTMTDAQYAIAPNVSELYAFNFANQVAAEIRKNTGLNFASPPSYRDPGPGTIASGPSFPTKN